MEAFKSVWRTFLAEEVEWTPSGQAISYLLHQLGETPRGFLLRGAWITAG